MEQTWNRIVKANNLDTNVWSYGISRDENAIQIAATIFQETHTALKSLGTKGAPTASNPYNSQLWTIGGRSFDVLTENKNNVQAMWGSMEIMNRQQLSNLFGEAWGQAQGYSGKSKGLNFFAGISQEQIHNLQTSLISGTGNVDFSSVAKSIGATSTEALSGYLYDAVIRPDQPLVGNQVSRQQGLLDQFGIGRAIGDLAIDVYGSKSKEEFFENFYRDFTDTRWDEAATNQFNALNVGGTKVAAGFIQGADETEKRALAKQLFNSMYRWEDRQVVENRGEGIENRGDVQSTLISKNTEVLLADRQRGAVYEYAGLMKSFDARYALSLEAQGMPGIYSYLKTTQFASEDPALNALRQLRGARQIAEEAIETGGNRSTPLENTGYQLGRTIGDKSVTARDMIDALESNAIKSPENGSSPEQAFSDWYNGRMAEMNMPVNSGVIWMPKSGLAIPNPALGLKTYAPGYSKGEDDRWTATSVNPVPGQLSGLMRRALDLEVGNVTPEELSEGTRDINKRMAGILQKITSGKELNQLEPAFGTSGRYAGNARVPENMVFLPDSELRRMMSVWGVRGMNTREFAETMNGMPALWNRAPTPSIGSTEHAGSIMPTYLMTSAHPIGREIQNDINQSHMQSAPIQINPFWMSMQGDLDFDPSSVMPIFDMQEVEENGEKKTQITDIRSNPGLMKEFESAVQNATSDRSQQFLYDVAFQGHEIGYKDPVADTLIPSYLYQMQLREERGEDTGLAEINRLSGEAVGDPDRFKNRRWLNEDKMKRYSQAIVGWNDMSAAGKEWDTNKNELMGKFFRTYQDRTISIGTALGASAGFIANALDYASLPYQTSVDFAGNPNEPLPNMVSSAHFAPVMKTGENNVRTPTGKWQLSAVVGSKQTKDGVTEDWQTLMDPSLSGMAGGSQEDFFGTVAGKLSGFASGNTHAMASWFASIVNGNPGATQQNWQTIKNELEPIYSQYAMGSTEREMAVKNAARGWYQRGVTGFNSIAPGMILSAAMTNTFVPGHTYSMRPEAFEAMQWYVGQFGDTQGQSGEYLVEHSPYALASELVDFRRNLSTNNYEKFDENGNPVFNGNEKLPNYLNMYNMVRAIRIADEQGITGPVYDQWRMNVPDQLGLTAGTTVQPPVVPQAPTPAPSSPSVVPNGSGPNGTVRPIVKNPSGTYTSNSATQTVFPGGAAQPRAPKSKRGRQSVGQTQGIPPEPPTSGDLANASGETPGNRLRLWNAQGEVNGYYEPPAFWVPGERPENVEGTPDLMQAIQALGEQISGAGDPSQYMIYNLLSINFGGPKTINAAARTTAAAIASGNASRMDDVRNKIGTELVQRIGQHYSIDTSGMTTTQAINAGIKADQAGANGFSEFIKANPDIHQAIIEANNAQRLSETIVNDRNKKYFWDKKTEAWGGTEAEATEAYRKQRVMAGQILTESGALDANVIRPNNPEDMITAEAYGAARLMSQVGIVRGKAKFPEPGDEYTSMDQKRYDNASVNMDAMTKSLEKMNKALLDGNEVTQKKVAAEIDLNKAREGRSNAELNLDKSVSAYEAEANMPAVSPNLGARTKAVIGELEGRVENEKDLAEKKRLSDHATTIRQQSEFLAQAQSSEAAADAAYKVANMDSRTGEIYDLFDQNQYNSQRRYFGSMFAIQGALAGEVASGHSRNAARLSRQGEMLSANQKEYMAEQSLGQLINPLDGGGATGSTIEQRADAWLGNQAGVINGLTGDARRDAVDKQNRVFGALNSYRQAKGNTDSAVSAYAQLTSAIEKPDLMWDQYDRNRSLLMGDMLDDTNASYAAIAGVRGRPLATQREVAEARLRDQHTRLRGVENSMREIVEPWETATGNGPSNAQTPVGSAPGPTIGQRAQDMIVTLQAQLSGMSDSDPRKASLIKNLNAIQGFAQQHSTLSGEVGQSEADYNVANLRASLPGTEGWTQHHENIFQNNVSAADEYAKKVENINKAMKDGNEVMEKRTKLEAKKTELEDKQKNLGEVMGAEGADDMLVGMSLIVQRHSAMI